MLLGAILGAPQECGKDPAYFGGADDSSPLRRRSAFVHETARNRIGRIDMRRHGEVVYHSAHSAEGSANVVKFSIITLVYNRKEDLERTARSVTSQRDASVE